ncbi:type VII secretion-associated serine protease mycosin [Gandjariella thermophila]|uniref:Type VII secretion-associated serine protease n=1 Tax=Gandjariella thermophila TaxID=1931992 RepID=A0A4D4JDG7_9PSEU|nr:type VII secretion-associated serine protease mycosin [Gandjariella thermophila]GDY33452.1 type VII secretion-associated serine protease [Gandjariella thermophila]
MTSPTHGFARLIGAACVVFGLSVVAATPAQGATRSEEWPLDSAHFRADDVWQHSQGNSITVAVLDTGVDARHPDLAGQVIAGTGFVGITGDTGQTDLSGDSHGTSIAGIISGTGKADNGSGMMGLAPGSRIMPVRVSLNGTAEPVALAKGIIYAADQQANVINISIGTTTPDPIIRSAVNYALGKGSIIVAAAGNSGDQGNPPTYPASFPGVVSVTAVDTSGRFWPRSESGPQTTLAAPGVDIFSANDHGGYLYGDGTSYAAPYVAATAALIWSQHRQLTAGQVIAQLIATANHKGDQPHDNEYGYGLINPLRALTTPPTQQTRSNPLLTAPPPAGPTSSGLEWLVPTIVGSIAVLVAITTLTIRRRRRAHATSKKRPAR